MRGGERLRKKGGLFVSTKMKLLIAIGFSILVTMLLSSCAERNGSEGIAPNKTNKIVRPVSKVDLEKYVNMLSSLETVFKSHHVKFQSSYSNEHEGFLEIRRIGDHVRSMSDEEKTGFRQSIYEAVGAEFPLNITLYTIGDQPGMTGKISAIDKAGRLLVISSDKFLDKEKKMPDAVWYAMTDDADITFEGKPLQARDIKIGSSVKVWSEGMMLASYPGQTAGLHLEITAWDAGIGNASGIVTGLEKTGEGVNEELTIEVDGVKHRLITIAKVWFNGENASASDIKVGDRVKIWFAGYEVGPEKMVTQVVIER
jgi:hypothetical protein